MSAVDFAARGIALRASAQSPLGFAELGQANLPASIRRIDSSGHDESGIGAATYVADSRANAALRTAHPLAVFVGAESRHFRLLGDTDGFITPEQIGCPPYVAGVNQQPWIQAAINYAQAVGLKGVKFPQERYELWAPPRIGAFTASSDSTGNFLVIDRAGISLLGMHANRTTLHCKGPAGGSLATNYQVMNAPTYGGDVIWRGHGLMLTGTASSSVARPADSALSHTIIRDLIFYTDAVGVRNNAWPAYPLSRDATGVRENCWDISNKGIYVQADVHVGNLLIENVDIIGFLGECIYTQNKGVNGNGRIVCRNLVMKHSNGQALNPNGPASFDVDGIYAENCSLAVEGWFGQVYGRLANAYFKDMNYAELSGGGDGYATPLRADNSMPVLQVENVVFENCTDLFIGSYVQGQVTVIDTRVAFVGNNASKVVRNNTLDITSICHKATVSIAIRFAPYAGTLQTVSNNLIRLSCYRTKYAADNGFKFASLWSQQGSLGPKNYLYARGEVDAIGTSTSVANNYVALIDEGLDLTTLGAPAFFDPSTIASPDMGTGWLRGGSFSVGAGLYTVNLPATTLYQANSEIVIEHRDSAKTTSFMEISDGTRRALLGYKDKAKFRCNKLYNRWDMVTPTPLRTAAASLAITSTALGSESGPYTVALPGCRPWHRAEIVPPATTGGFSISTVRAETDQVKFWMKNMDGANPATLTAQSYTARCWIASV